MAHLTKSASSRLKRRLHAWGLDRSSADSSRETPTAKSTLVVVGTSEICTRTIRHPLLRLPDPCAWRSLRATDGSNESEAGPQATTGHRWHRPRIRSSIAPHSTAWRTVLSLVAAWKGPRGVLGKVSAPRDEALYLSLTMR